MEQDKAPLSDLSFFRFPDLTPDVVRNIALLFLLLALTVLLTVLVHKRLQRRQALRERRARFDRFADEQRMQPRLRAMLLRLMQDADMEDEFAFAYDADAFERAAERVAERADAEELADLATLRRSLHLNVMNPEVRFVSTRQLLQDLPVRIEAMIGGEKLDLYCTLLAVDERYLLLDLPQDAEVRRLLRTHRDVLLLVWRENGGEAVFRITLEPLEDGDVVAFRARHAFRDTTAQQRTAFRLAVDLPATYQFVQRGELARRLGRAGEPRHLSRGDARITDLSFGGASLIVSEPLEERGLAQLHFDLQGKPVRLMLEVLSTTALTGGGWLVRGQFRGLGEDARVRLHAVLTREQLRRLRERESVRVRQAI